MEYCILFSALFGINSRPDLERQQEAVPVGVERENSKIEKKDKYEDEDEVNALARHFGGLQAGTGLCITLQELLALIPRQRKRRDAYRRLVSYLKDTYKIELTIKSRKHGN